MSRIKWDETGARTYETGVKNGVLYVFDANQEEYGSGVAWNGLTGVTNSPSGAEATALYADDIKYLTLYSAEDFGATIEAYTYPDEFEQCDGSAEIVPGVLVRGQERKMFAFSYVTTKGNDTLGNAYGKKIHIIYGARAGVSERAYSTINDSPEAITFSWEITTTPVTLEGYKPVAHLEIDSTKVDATLLEAFENTLYGTVSTDPTLLLPEAIIEAFSGNPTYTYTPVSEPAAGTNPMGSGWYERVGGTGTSEDPYVYVKTADTSLANAKTYYTLVVTNPT